MVFKAVGPSDMTLKEAMPVMGEKSVTWSLEWELLKPTAC